MDQFRKNGTTSSFLSFAGRITCGTEMFNDLIEILQCTDLEILQTAHTKNEFLQLHSVRKINSNYIYNCAATDRELLKLKSNNILLHTDQITSRGIGKFLDQWRHGQRNIDFFNLQFDTTKATRTGDDMVRWTDATLEWSPETHKDSVLGEFPMQHLQNMAVTYSIKRITPSTEAPEVLLLKLEDDNVVASVQDPWQYLKYQVEQEIYYDIKRECIWCDTKFCEHFKRYTVGRFRRAFPWIFKSIGFSFTISKYSTYPLQAVHLSTTFDNAYLRTTSSMDTHELNDFNECDLDVEHPILANIGKEDSKSVLDPFHITALPLELQYRIVQKFDFKTYTMFEKCSKQSKTTCLDQIRFPLERMFITVNTINGHSVKVYSHTDNPTAAVKFAKWQDVQSSKAQLRVDQIEICCALTAELCQKLIASFKENGTTARRLVMQPFPCEPTHIAQLIEAIKASEIYTIKGFNLSRPIIQLLSVKKFSWIVGYDSEATDADIISLRCPYLHIEADHVSSQAIVKYIEDWRYGKRDIDFLALLFEVTKGTRSADDVVFGLDAELVWSREIHESTLIGAVRLDCIDAFESTYRITRLTPTNGEPTTILLRIRDEYIFADPCDLDVYLINLVDCQEYYRVWNKCKTCKTQFCQHFGAYSLGRLRRTFPKVTSSMGALAGMARFPLLFLLFTDDPTTITWQLFYYGMFARWP